MAGEEAVTLLRYQIDQASVNAAVAANQKVAASTQAIAQATVGGGGVLRFDSIEQAAAQLGVSANRLLATEEAITSEKQQQLTLANLRLDLERQAQAAFVDRQGGGRGIGGGIARASRSLFNLPDVQLTPGISTTVISRLGLVAGSGLEAVGASLATVAAGAAVAVPLIAGVVAVTSAYGSAAQAATERASTFTEAFKQALEAGTTAQIQELIKRQQNEIRIAEITRDLLLEKQKEAPAQLASFLDTSSQDLAARLNQAANDIGIGDGTQAVFPEAVQTAESYNGAIEEQNKLISDGEIALEAMRLALSELFVQTNDAAAAEDALREVRRQAVDEIFRGQSQYTDAFVRGSGLTAEARDKEVASLEQQKASLEALIASGSRSTDEIQILNDRIDGLDNQLAGLTDASTEYADALAREEAAKKAATDTTDNYFELLDQEAAAREKIADIQERIGDIAATRDERLEDIAEDRAEREAGIAEDTSERLIEIGEDARDRRLKLERDAGRDLFDAVAERDEVTYRKTKQRAEDALKDQDEQATKQVEKVQKQIEKQEQQLERSYAKQVENVVQSSNKQIIAQQRALAQQEFLVAQSQQSQAFLTAYGMNQVTSTVATGWNAVVNYTVTAFNNIMAAAARTISGGTTIQPLTGSAADRALEERMRSIADQRMNEVLVRAAGGRVATR